MWTEEKLNEMLITPSEKLVEDIAKIKGDIMVLGAGGKMGPTLCILAKRAAERAGVKKKIIAVSHGSVTGVFTSVTKKAPLAQNAKRVLQNCHLVIFSYDGEEILMEGYDISPENLNLLEIE